MSSRSFPLAVEAPDSPATPLTATLLAQTAELSRQSPRGRIIQRLHTADDAPLHRMFNAMQPGTYLRPHRHMNPPKSEAFVMLAGAVRFVEFNDTGKIVNWFDMRAGGEVFGVDVEPGVWHGLIVLEPDSVIFEVKNGPYTKASDKDFAPWSPEEGTPEAQAYLKELLGKTDGPPRT